MNKRVLIVEDDVAQSEGLCRLLRSRRIASDCAHSFNHGTELANRNGYDAAIVDLNLPDSPPMQTIERMAEIHPERAIAFTGIDDPGIIRECQRRGLTFILKGTPAKSIIGEILKMMEMHDPSEEIERAMIENARTAPPPQLPWYQRLAPVMGLVATLLISSFTGGAYLFKVISDRAAIAVETQKHFEKIDAAIVEQKDMNREWKQALLELQTKAQISIDDRSHLHAEQEQLRGDVIRRLERIEDKVTQPLSYPPTTRK